MTKLPFAVFLLPSLVVACRGTPAAADDIFVSNYSDFAGDPNSGSISEYTSSGAVVNTTLVGGLADPYGIAVAGNNLYVVNPNEGTVSEFNATTGATINANFITGLSFPQYVAVSNGNLYVTNGGNNTIGEYSANTGAAINVSLVTGLAAPEGLAVSGGDVYVANLGEPGYVGVYDATTGSAINPTLIYGVNEPIGVAVSGNDLFISLLGSSTIAEYTTSGLFLGSISSGLRFPQGIAVSGNELFAANIGDPTSWISEYDTSLNTLNASLITQSSGPVGIAVLMTPEPSSLELLGLGALAIGSAALSGWRRRAERGA